VTLRERGRNTDAFPETNEDAGKEEEGKGKEKLRETGYRERFSRPAIRQLLDLTSL